MNMATNLIDIKSMMSNVSTAQPSTKSATTVHEFKQYLNAENNQSLKLTQAEMLKIDETAEEFEAMFLTSMLEQMYSGMELENPFGGGNSENIYRSMLIGKYAENMASSGGVGIANQLKDSMYKMQLGI